MAAVSLFLHKTKFFDSTKQQMQIHIARVSGSSVVWGCLLHTDGQKLLQQPTLVAASKFLHTERRSCSFAPCTFCHSRLQRLDLGDHLFPSLPFAPDTFVSCPIRGSSLGISEGSRDFLCRVLLLLSSTLFSPVLVASEGT